MTATALIRARVLDRRPGTVEQIALGLDDPFHFAAGQYLCLCHDSGEQIPLSIASGPGRLPELHLHFQPQPGSGQSARVLAMLDSGAVTLTGPFGRVKLTELAEPLFMVAGGSGAAQCFGLLDALMAAPPAQTVQLLWCADSEAELYRRQWLEREAPEWLRYQLIADPRRDQNNAGMAQLKALAPHLRSRHQILLCGSPGFVYAATDVLLAGGVAGDRMRSDVYDYAPRSP